MFKDAQVLFALVSGARKETGLVTHLVCVVQRAFLPVRRYTGARRSRFDGKNEAGTTPVSPPGIMGGSTHGWRRSRFPKACGCAAKDARR